MGKKDILKNTELLVGLAAVGAGVIYLLTREPKPPPPDEYPKTVSRGDYSFEAHNLNEWNELNDFLGIIPAGSDDLDIHLATLDDAGLLQWKNYWTNIFNFFTEQTTMINFVSQKYDEYYTAPDEWPKIVSRGVYSFNAHNLNELTQLKGFLGIDPSAVDLDTHLNALDNTGLLQWKTYWDSIFLNFIEKNTLMAFVQAKYDQYYEEEPPPEYPKTISRYPYDFTANDIYEEVQLKDFLGIEPVAVDMDTYLDALDNAGLLNWKNYWTAIFNNIGRTDLVTFVAQKYNQYYTAPTTGTFSLTSSPTNANIYLNGSYKGTTPKSLTVDANTSYTVKFTKTGYIPLTIGLNVAPGATKSYNATLPPEQQYGTFSLSSSPTGASIYLNGSYKGTTPINFQVNANQGYTVECSKSGYITSAVGKSVSAGGTMNYNFTLTPETPPEPEANISNYEICSSITGTCINSTSYQLWMDRDASGNIEISFDINNIGDVSHAFYGGCSIITPNGTEITSRDFYYSKDAYSQTISKGNSVTFSFKEKINYNYVKGVHTIVVAAWDKHPETSGARQLYRKDLYFYAD